MQGGRRAWVAAAAALMACAPAPDDSPGAREAEALGLVRDAIVGGTIDNGDPEVFMLIMQYNTGTGSGCTATLIASRTLLTAAHCVDPRTSQATSVQIWAMNKTDQATAGYYDLIKVVETRMHPSWNPAYGSIDHDIAMVLLETAPAVATPKPWNTTSVNYKGGQALRAVGYGITGSAGTGSGVKRQVNLTFRQIDSDHIYLGDLTGKGVCSGDSGGPSFHTFSDGVERQVGIHSYTRNSECTDGADIRTDYYASFINAWLGEKEGPQCSRDGQCKTGCVPYDLDCYCVADNVCNPQCPELTKDPDCPPDCIANSVCSTRPCPTPDVDCVAEGSKCTSEVQCVGRQCVSDPQHQDFYCSRSCTQSSECPLGMSCPSGGGICRYPVLPTADPGQGCKFGQTFCVGGPYVCTGPVGGSTTCARTCTANGDCPVPQTCETGQNDFKYCKEQVKPMLFITRAKTEGDAAPSCEQGPGAPGWWALGLGAAALRRRRRSERR